MSSWWLNRRREDELYGNALMSYGSALEAHMAFTGALYHFETLQYEGPKTVRDMGLLYRLAYFER